MFRDQNTADARIISRIMEMTNGNSNPDPELVAVIVSLFYDRGGRWESFFKGDPEHSKLLKDCIRYILQKKNG